MINANEIIKKFTEEFDRMSYEEREAYLKQMGFVFEEKRKAEYVKPSFQRTSLNRDAFVAARKGTVMWARKGPVGAKKRKNGKRKIKIQED